MRVQLGGGAGIRIGGGSSEKLCSFSIVVLYEELSELRLRRLGEYVVDYDHAEKR